MLVGVVVLAACILFGSALLYTRTSPFAGPPRCPNCQIPYVRLGQPEDPDTSRAHRAYEVFACPECTNTITRVHGTPSRFAYCPSCAQRTLETPTRRLAPTVQAPLAVAIEERCHVCGYHDEQVLPEGPLPVDAPARGKGQVIPFPSER